MKDKLEREITKGDVLARVRHNYSRGVPVGELVLYDVIDVAPFAIQVQARAGGDIDVLTHTDNAVIVL